MNRREFGKVMVAEVAGMTTPLGAQQAARTLQIGHTSITWLSFGGGGRAQGGRQGATPAGTSGGPAVNKEQIDTIIGDIADLGFWGVEVFGNAVTGLEDQGTIGVLLKKHHDLPLISIVASPNCGDRSKLKESIDLMITQGKAAKKYGASIVLMNASGARRDASYNFADNKSNIAYSLNEASKAMADIGLQAVLHQHTGTMVETREEVYAIMSAVDSKYVKAGFDVGQLAKGGSDPVQILRDFLPQIEHMHLKDFNGGEQWLGYCPLGQGRVDLKAILDLMEKRGPMKGRVMVELDSSPNQPIPARECARIAKTYLEKLGYGFRTI